MSDNKKQQALELALKQIEKQFGKGSIMKLGDGADHSIAAIPSGSIALDIALGIGGYPRGRIIEVYGPESSGKTTLTLHAMASAQKQGGTVAFIDAEHALDPNYAKNLGIDIDNLVLSQPDTGEQALDIAEALIKSGSIDMIVIDSVAALVPEQEIAGDILRRIVPSEGSVWILGQETTRIRERRLPFLRRKIGMVFQDHRLLPNMNALDNLVFTLRATGERGNLEQRAMLAPMMLRSLAADMLA